MRTGGKLLVEIARELGISTETLRRWRKQANHETRQTRQGSDEAADVGHTSHTTREYTAQEELRQVRQENRMLREERELLLRAAAIFVTQISSIRSIR